MDQAQLHLWWSGSFALLWRYRNHFPQATFAQSVTNPLPQSEAQTALTGMFPLAIYRKKAAAGAGIVEKPSRENEFKAFVPIPYLSLSRGINPCQRLSILFGGRGWLTYTNALTCFVSRIEPPRDRSLPPPRATFFTQPSLNHLAGYCTYSFIFGFATLKVFPCTVLDLFWTFSNPGRIRLFLSFSLLSVRILV